MSRGAGRVQSVIERMMDERSDDMLLIADMAVACFPGVNRIEKKHRVSIARAAWNACRRKGWNYRRMEAPGGMNVYFNTHNVRSYVLSMLRAAMSNQNIPDYELRQIIDGKADPRHWHKHYLERMKPGAVFWLHVEINKAVTEGRSADAATHRAALDKHIRETYGPRAN